MKAISGPKYCLGLIAVLILGFLLPVQAAPPAPMEKNILIIHQFAAEYPAHQAFNEELIKIMQKESGYKFNYSYEYLNMEKFAQHDAYLEATAQYIKLKQQFSNWAPDIIVASDGVTDFLSLYANELFGEVPIVSVWSGDILIPTDLNSNHVVISVFANFDKNIQLIIDTQKNLKNIYVVIGHSYSEQYIPGQIEKAAEPYLGQINFVYLNELSYADMMLTLQQIPEDSAIMFVRWVTDIQGETFVPVRVVSAIAKEAKAPVYGTQLQYLGTGVIGGYLYNQGLLGQSAAQMALRIIGGEQPQDITVMDDESHEYVFDERALNRWHISRNDLPANSIIEYKKEDIWSAYGIYMIAGAFIILLEMALIAGLIKNRKNRVIAEGELLLLNNSLENLVDERTQELTKASVKLEEANGQLDHASRIDLLTGLYNRRHMQERLNQEYQLFIKTGDPFSIMIMDIDDFKKTNDQYGHEAGDEVLKLLSDSIHKLIRADDVLARWGGEEFLLLFPGLKSEDTSKRAESIRMTVEQQSYPYQGQGLSLTITIGTATIRQSETIQEVIKRADDALYEGKRTGKNKIVTAS
ncbi:MAG: diguanylate cyclase [Clostridiales bacterium]|nr:diguanylate cyclase [Clostridiales bacterium]